MEELNSENHHIGLLRHLKDIDDLRDSRDSGIESGQEGKAEEIAERIISYAENNKSKIIILFISTKKRTTETAHLIISKIKNANPELKVILSQNPDLVDLDHGEYILPPDYKSGDYYEPFRVAWEAFLTEAFDHDNPDYRFGDPKIKEDGSFSYPSMAGYFTGFGESQIDINLRLYKAIIDGYDMKERLFSDNIQNVVLTHSLPYAIFRQLVEVNRRVEEEGFKFEKGKLYKVCWEIYNNSNGEYDRGYGDLSDVEIDLLESKKFVDLLKEEVEFLKSKYEKKI